MSDTEKTTPSNETRSPEHVQQVLEDVLATKDTGIPNTTIDQIETILEQYLEDLKSRLNNATSLVSVYTDIISFLTIILKNWWLIGLVGIVGTGIAFLVISMQTPIYETQTSVSVLPNFAQDSIPRPIQEIEIALGTYLHLLRSRSLISNVENALYDRYTDEVLDEVDTIVRPVEQSVFIIVTVQSSDPTLAQTYAMEIVKQLTERNPLPLFEVTYKVEVLDEAYFPKNPSYPEEKKSLALGALGSLMVGVMLAFLRDTYIKLIR